MPPDVVTTNFTKLVDAVGNAAYMAERVKMPTVKNTHILKSLTQFATRLSSMVHIHTHRSVCMRSESTMSSHRCLARARRLLASASRVARALHDLTWNMDPQANKTTKQEERSASDDDMEGKN